MIGGSMMVLLMCSSLRHLLFQSTAFDLGYFDQAAYLISQGQPPVVSFWGFHFLGGHADWILYFVALLYKVYPSVYWLFAVQAIALSLGALPLWHLACQAGLKEGQATAIAAAYLLYPLIFNLNLFDFHPEVIALPLMLTAVLAARLDQVGWFTVCLVFVLGCRDALSLTVVAMGVWLLVFEKKRGCGAIALFLGMGWFVIVTQVLIPNFRPGGVEAVPRYAYLGNSLAEIAQNLILKPHLVLGGLFTLANLEYLCLLFLPVIWGLSWRSLAPLVGVIPTLTMNLLSTLQTQKDLVHQYSLPAVPFLFLAVITALSQNRGWVQSRRGIILCSLIGFLALAKVGYFGSRYLSSLDTWNATRTALAQVSPKGGVLTTAAIAPHVTHRSVVKLAVTGTESTDLGQFNTVLLNVRHPGWMSSSELLQGFVNRLQQDTHFKLQYQHDDVYLFIKPQVPE
ncbi:MAG: DUF2079 domain-containing protein [Leptolyngbyaceae cyanobacterium RU_5_1]|nr:DUF2079 domain-containing protein [Leptolyngbyaceae cyanobacterium RU_5_1]